MDSEKLYQYLHSIFGNESISCSQSTRTQKVGILFTSTVQILQIIRFFWTPYLNYDFWDNYKPFWFVLAYSCPDILAASIGFFGIFSLIVVSLLFLCALTLFLQMILLFKSKNLPICIIQIFRFVTYILCEVFFVSSCTSLIILFKYSHFINSVISEFPGDLDSNEANFGKIGEILSLLSLMILITLTFLYESCNFEVRHSLADIDLYAKAFPNTDIQLKIIMFTSSCFYISLLQSSYQIGLVLEIIMFGFCAYQYFSNLPYYSSYMNCAKILINFEAFCIGCFFILGSLLQNSSVTFILCIFLQPLIIISSLSYIKANKTSLTKSKESINFTLKKFELASRELWKSSENYIKLLKYMNYNYDRQKDKMLFVFQAYYCNDILKNSTLAAMKLSRAEVEGYKIITNFQIYKCMKILKTRGLAFSEGLKLSLFLLDLDMVNDIELRFCEVFLKLLTSIIMKNVEIRKLFEDLKSFYMLLDECKKKYVSITGRFPDSSVVNRNFGTFLSDILHEKNLGQVYLSRSQVQYTNKKSQERQFNSYSNPESCICIVSGSYKNIGKMIYMSYGLCQLLKINSIDTKSYSLNDFIPHPYNKAHNKKLMRFIVASSSEHIFRETPLYLLTSEGFIVGCIFRGECVGYEFKANFVVFIEPMNGNQDAAIISQKGLIYSHTKRFPAALGLDFYKIEQTFLHEYIPYESFQELIAKKYTVILNYKTGHASAIVLQETIIGTKTVISINIIKEYKDKEQILNCISQGRNLERELTQFQAQVGDDNFFYRKQKSRDESRIKSHVETKILTDKFKSVSKSSSTSKYEQKILKNFSKIFRLFKALKIIFFTMAFGIIVANFILLAFVCAKVNKSINSDAANLLDEIYLKFGEVGLYSRIIDLNYRLNTTFFYNSSDILELYTSFIQLGNKLRSSDLEYCPESALIKDNTISQWLDPKSKILSYSNINNLIQASAKNTEKIYMKLIKNDYNFNSEMFFLIFNSLKSSLFEVKNAYNNLQLCDHQKVNNISESSSMIMIGCSIAILALFISLVIIASLLSKDISKIMQFFLGKAKENYPSMRLCILDRLYNQHNVLDADSDIEKHGHRSNIVLKTSRNYIFIALATVLTCLICFIVFYYYFIVQIQNSMIFRIDFLNTMGNRRSKMVQLSYMTLEILANEQDQELCLRYGDFCYFPEFKSMFTQLNIELRLLRQKLHGRLYKIYTPQSVWDMLYKSTDLQYGIFSKGLSQGLTLLRRETYFLIQMEKTLSFQDFEYYFKQLKEGIDSFKWIIPVTDNAIKDAVNTKVIDLVYFNVGLGVFFIVIYLFGLRRFFNRERETLGYIETAFQIIY
ncbi:hypothetical protein SteCoe_27615 [Stentor coeruleus]|uniref:Uncharacterized protein n=1 Tax=Stentor coeruleus TaxID=5963 RepID=A0A1R2BA66_9CILI|nr:hypothetical protein SteCoe_27615 [Stentor coeruleus]